MNCKIRFLLLLLAAYCEILSKLTILPSHLGCNFWYFPFSPPPILGWAYFPISLLSTVFWLQNSLSCKICTVYFLRSRWPVWYPKCTLPGSTTVRRFQKMWLNNTKWKDFKGRKMIFVEFLQRRWWRLYLAKFKYCYAVPLMMLMTMVTMTMQGRLYLTKFKDSQTVPLALPGNLPPSVLANGGTWPVRNWG